MMYKRAKNVVQDRKKWYTTSRKEEKKMAKAKHQAISMTEGEMERLKRCAKKHGITLSTLVNILVLMDDYSYEVSLLVDQLKCLKPGFPKFSENIIENNHLRNEIVLCFTECGFAMPKIRPEVYMSEEEMERTIKIAKTRWVDD